MHAFALTWNSYKFILPWKNKNHYYSFVRNFYVNIESVPMLGKHPVFFPAFIMPMKVCRWLVVISLDTKKTKFKKEYEGASSFKCIKHSRDRLKHEVTEPVYIRAYKSRFFRV